MQREVEELLRVGDFHDVALVDDADAVGDKPDDGEVMGDEQIGDVPFLLELFQQVQHLGADGHVQGGDGLVGDDELGLHDHGPSQADALTLAAGKLVGVAGQMLREEADLFNDFLNLGHALLLTLEKVEVIQAF